MLFTRAQRLFALLQLSVLPLVLFAAVAFAHPAAMVLIVGGWLVLLVLVGHRGPWTLHAR